MNHIGVQAIFKGLSSGVQRWKWVMWSWVMGHHFWMGHVGHLWVTASDPLTRVEITAQ